MAVMKAIRIMVWAYSDGTATTCTVKLATDGDPYWVAANSPTGIGGHVANWFAQPNAANAPKGVKVVDGCVSAGLAIPTSILTITFEPKPNGELQEFILDLLFA